MSTIPDGKSCRKCGEWKPRDQFSKAAREPDGLQSACKDCNRAYRIANRETIRQKKSEYVQRNREETRRRSRARYAENAERNREAKREYRATHPDRVRESARKSIQKNQDRIRDRRELYRSKHRDRLNKNTKVYYRSNRERLLEYAKTYRRSNYGRVYQGIRAWKRRNPAKVRVSHHRRRVRARNAGGNFTAAQWQAMCDWFGNVCLACGAKGPLTIDHVVPIAKRGSNDISNLQPLCGHCNSGKQDKTTDYRNPDSLRRFLETLT